MSTVNNLILDKGGTNEITVYTTSVKEMIIKALKPFTPPQSSINWGSGPKSTWIIDLLRVEERFTVNGYINESDKTKIKNIIKAGGVLVMEWDGNDININLDKLEITKNQNEDDHRDIMFTCIKGEDL